MKQVARKHAESDNDPWEILRACGQPGLFITATDTNIGKTTVTAALAGAFTRLGVKVGICKAVASGCPRHRLRGSARGADDDKLFSPDAAIAAKMAGLDPTDTELLKFLSPIRFAAPVSPHVAARLERRRPDWRRLAEAIDYWRRHCELLLVEGAGGWLVPLDDNLFTVADLAIILALPVVVISTASLGTLNHSWLTVESIRSRRLPLAGLVANRVRQPPDLIAATNLEEMPRLMRTPLLAALPETTMGRKGDIPASLVEALAPFAEQWWQNYGGSSAGKPRSYSRIPGRGGVSKVTVCPDGGASVAGRSTGRTAAAAAGSPAVSAGDILYSF